MANIEIFGTLVRNDNNTNRDKIVQAVQVEGGYFVCESLPTAGTWQKGQLCYCTGTSAAPVNKYYNYNGSSWVVASFSDLSGYLPRSGGNMTGHIYLTGANENSSTANTSQIVFGTSTNQHVAISSNSNTIVINPNTAETTNQIVLYLDKQSEFPSGINSSGTINAASLTQGGTAVSLDGHAHDGRYYTESEVDTKLSGKSDVGHAHDDRYYTESEIDTKLNGKSNTGHNHDDRYYTESEIDTKLNGKSNTNHTHFSLDTATSTLTITI